MLLAAGFETASQLSALILAGQNNALLVGAVFSSGMVLVDGVDGYLAASMVRRAAFGEARAKWASRLLGLIVVIFAFGLGGAELSAWISPGSLFRWDWPCSQPCWESGSGRGQVADSIMLSNS